MRILVLVSHLSGGGAERVAGALAGAWARAGHSVRLAIVSPLGEVEYRPDPGVDLISLDEVIRSYRLLGRASRILARIVALRRVVVETAADVTVAIQANLAIEVALGCVGTAHRIIGCEHNNPAFSVRGRLWRILRPLAYRRLDAVTTLARGAAQQLARCCPTARVVVLPNPVRWPMAEGEPRIVPDTVVPDDRHVVLAAGRLVEAKGFDSMIDAFAILAARRDDVDLVIAGSGPLEGDLRARVARHGLSDRIHLLGRVGNLPDWYARSSLFLMTSLWEGMPMVMLEAMNHGVPLVCQDFDYGPRDVVRDGVDGIVVPDRSATSLNAAISLLLDDPERRAAMAAAATKTRVTYGETAILARWDRLFAEVLGGRSSSAPTPSRR